MALPKPGGFCLNYRLNLTGWDYNPSVISFRNATSLCTREAIPPGYLGIPLPSFLQQVAENPPFAQPQTADPSVCFADISPNRGVSSRGRLCPPGCLEIPLPSFLQQVAEKPPSPKGRLIASVECGGRIRPFSNGMGFSPHPSRLYCLWRATFPQGKAEMFLLQYYSIRKFYML